MSAKMDCQNREMLAKCLTESPINTGKGSGFPLICPNSIGRIKVCQRV